MTKSIISQLSIIMTSSFDIVSLPRIRGGIRKVSGGTTAGPRRIRGGIRVSRGGIESGQVRGSAGGLEKLSAGVSGLVKKNLDCTVCMYVCTYSCSRYRLETSCMDSSWKNSRHVFLVFPELSPLVKLRPFDKQGDEIL